jgi:hypothetical protein
MISACIDKLSQELNHTSKGKVKFTDLWYKKREQMTPEDPSLFTLMYWLLNGYVPGAIAEARARFAAIHREHKYAKGNALAKLILKEAIRLHHNICKVRTIHNQQMLTRRKHIAHILNLSPNAEDEQAATVTSNQPQQIESPQHLLDDVVPADSDGREEGSGNEENCYGSFTEDQFLPSSSCSSGDDC